jgi:hypothetical protein
MPLISQSEDRPCYLDLHGSQVVAYSPERATHDPVEEMLVIAETILAEDAIVWTVFSGRAFVDGKGLIRTVHPHGWCPNPPEPFCTSVKTGDVYEFLQCYETIEDAREAHSAWVENILERMDQWREAGFSIGRMKGKVWE